MLSPDKIRQREGKLTASRVACLMTGDEEKILNLWRELVGDPSFVPEDLSDVLPVQIGIITEPLNVEWYQKRTGHPLTKCGDVIVHPDHAWAACTLDGWDAVENAPVECKHVGGYEPIAKILERYAPQAHWQMEMTNARKCIFSIFEGNSKWSSEVVEYNDAYADELWARAVEFMHCVETLTPPVALPAVAAPVKAVKTYDMSTSNEWGNHAATWVANKDAAKDFDSAAKSLKALVPADAVKCVGHGIFISRSKAGALSIKIGE